MNNFGFKELYDVSLKTTYPIEIEGRLIEAGETIAVFDKIQMASFEENRITKSANGGYDGRALVWWDETKEVRLRLMQGVFSKTHLALMSNAALIKPAGKKTIRINQREVLESDEKGKITTKKVITAPVFVYNANTGEKLTTPAYYDKTVVIGQPFQ